MNPAMLAAMSGQMAAAGSNAAASAYGQGFGMGLEHLGGVNSQNASLSQEANLANQRARLSALGMQMDAHNNMVNRAYDTANNYYNNATGTLIGSLSLPKAQRGFSSWGPQVIGALGRGAAAYFSGGMSEIPGALGSMYESNSDA
jgi:hypothetical protein